MFICKMICELGTFDVFALLQTDGYFVAMVRNDAHNVPRVTWYGTGYDFPSLAIHDFADSRTSNGSFRVWKH